MVAFTDWLAHRNVETLLRLLESADYFNPQQYNSAFIEGLDELLVRIHDPVAREQIMSMRDFDFGNFISRSLLRSGFRGDDVQEYLHDVVVRLLLKPGKLFRGWNPKQHGTLDRRFKAAVWNRIRNISEKERNRRKWTTATDPTTMSAMYAGREPHSSSLVDQFRRVVAERLGTLGVFILDWRLGKREVKELVGMPELGSPTVYRIKREVQKLKQLAHDFAVKHDDPDFLRSIERGIAGEAKTVQKRQQSVLAKQAGGSA